VGHVGVDLHESFEFSEVKTWIAEMFCFSMLKLSESPGRVQPCLPSGWVGGGVDALAALKSWTFLRRVLVTGNSA